MTFIEACQRSPAARAFPPSSTCTAQSSRRTSAITAFLRGLAFSELTVTGPSRDLHSGIYGGPARNPIRVLADLLADMHDTSGRVTLAGFYEGVVTPNLAQLAQWRSLGFDADAFLGSVGLATPAGEEGMSVIEQLWSRPTAEINGIFGGYTGPGKKTVIPARALPSSPSGSFPISSLHKFSTACIASSRNACPRIASRPLPTKADRPRSVSTHRLQSSRQPRTRSRRSGVSLRSSSAAAHRFRSWRPSARVGLECLLVGFALDDDRIHSPNEKYNVKSFTKGARSWARLLGELGTIDGHHGT
jgi:hypothetical protein